MHSGPIKLPEPIQVQCRALINLGGMLQIYSIPCFMHCMDVYNRIVSDEANLLDLQDVVRLCDEIIFHPAINDNLKSDLTSFKNLIEMFIAVASQPTKTCGEWTKIQLPFDDDQLL